MRPLPAILACLLVLAWLSPLPARASDPPAAGGKLPVDLELVLAVDISGSIDREEASLQRQGYVRALLDPVVVRAITGGPHGRIALAYLEWAGPLQTDWLVRPTLIDGAAAAADFAARLQSVPLRGGHRTSISTAILEAASMIHASPFEGTRKVIDISGDGPNNAGFPINHARDQTVDGGLVVNGLVILNDRPDPYGLPVLHDLDLYYEDCVIGGPGSFMLVTEGFESFATAVRQKLILEIAGIRPPWPGRRAGRQDGIVPASHVYGGVPDCLIGEKHLWLLNHEWRFAPDAGAPALPATPRTITPGQ